MSAKLLPQQQIIRLRKQLNPPVLQWDKYVTIARSYGLTEEQTEVATGLFSTWGELLHFESSRLHQVRVCRVVCMLGRLRAKRSV